MFEGKLPLVPVAHDCGPDFRGDPGDAAPLRAMSWSDLRASLEAARDLRASLSARSDEHMASFDAHSARHIAGLTESYHGINPDDLANGKSTGRMDVPTADVGISGDPRK
jgi:hypothetical protein